MAACQPILTASTVAYIGWLTHMCTGWHLSYIMFKFVHRTQSMHPGFEEPSIWGAVKLQTIILIHEKINSTDVYLIIQGTVSIINKKDCREHRC